MSEYYWDDKMIDFGCGFGYLGLKLLPLLPKGSTYTGIDKGLELIETAKERFANQTYSTCIFFSWVSVLLYSLILMD